MRRARGSIVTISPDRHRIFVTPPPDPNTGERRRKSKTIRGSRRDAEDAMMRMVLEADAGLLDGDTTLGAYVEAVRIPSLKAKGRKERTVRTAEDRYRLYLQPTFESVKLSDITPRMVRKWLEGIDGQSKRFVAYTALREVLNHAVKNECLEASPLAKVDVPKRGGYEPAMLDEQDIEVYRWHFSGTPVEAAVLLAIGDGLRRGEIAALDWEDISPTSGKVVIDDTYVQHGSKVIHTSPKSKHSDRGVHTPASILKRLWEIAPDKATGAILVEDGQRMKPDRITALYSQWLKKLPPGVPRIPLKNLRHTSLTLAYDNGADILAVSRRGGHSSTAITEQYYLRSKGSRDKEVAEAMDKALQTRAKVCQSPGRTVFLREVLRF